MRTRAPAVLAAVLALAAASAAHGAGTLTLGSPTPGEETGTTPEFSGTGFTDGISSVQLAVNGPKGFTTAAPVYGDGTWLVSGQQLTAGTYDVVACQQDSTGQQVCTGRVEFTVRGGSDGGFTAKPPQGTFRQLLAGELTVPVNCPEECTVAARLTIPAKDGRKMGIPNSRANPVLGQETDEDTFPAGRSRLRLAPPSKLMARRLRAALAFPLFGKLVVKVEIQADWGDVGSFYTSVTGKLRWPAAPIADGRDGSILAVDPPDSVSASARTARFTVQLARVSGSLPVAAGVRAAGASVDVRTSTLLTTSGATATPAALRRGGTFVAVVTWDEEAARDASGVTPIPAEAWVRRGRDRAATRFTLG